jgi:hypothetical protein
LTDNENKANYEQHPTCSYLATYAEDIDNKCWHAIDYVNGQEFDTIITMLLMPVPAVDWFPFWAVSLGSRSAFFDPYEGLLGDVEKAMGEIWHVSLVLGRNT